MRLVVLAAAAAVPTVAAAQDVLPGVRDLGGPRALALGDAYRASAAGNEALFMNPAAMAVYARYEIDAFGLWDPIYGHHEIQISLVDNKTNAGSDVPLSAGVAYTNFVTGKGSSAFGGSLVHLGLAYAIYPPLLYIGATGKYMWLGGATHANSITFDAGAMVRLSQQLVLAGVLYNVIDVRSAQAPRMLGLAINYGGDGPAHLEADWRIDFSSVPGQVKFTYCTGGEYLIYNLVWIRAGYMRDEIATVYNASTGTYDPSQWATTGFAVIIGQRFSIDAAYRNEIGGVASKEVQVGLRFIF